MLYRKESSIQDSKALSVIERPDPAELYQILYRLSKKDYKVIKARELAKRSLSLLILILSILGIFFTVFYFTFVHDSMKDLNNEIIKYRDSITSLNTEVEKLSASELEYKNQIKTYEDIFNKLKIEDNRIIDFDLTEAVQKNIEKIDGITGDYKNIHRGNTNFKETALTFDLGTGEELPYVYSVLKRFNAKATIFLSNEMPSTNYGSLFKEKNIHYLIKMSKLGCEFGNHTWSHYNLKKSLYETSKRYRINLTFVSDDVLDELAIKLEFDRVRDRFYRETGIVLSPLWRAPYGDLDERILTIAAKAGYPNHVFWSSNKIGPLDFYDYINRRFLYIKNKNTGKYYRKRNPYYFTSAEMLARMKEWEKNDRFGLNGTISICHLGTSRKVDKMIHILPEYISYFQNKGYHFVLVSELIKLPAQEL